MELSVERRLQFPQLLLLGLQGAPQSIQLQTAGRFHQEKFLLLHSSKLQLHLICRDSALISKLCLLVSVVPDAVVISGTFQGTGAAAEAQRAPVNLDFAQWNSQATMEDMQLTCQRPQTVSAARLRTREIQIHSYSHSENFIYKAEGREGEGKTVR